LDRRAWVETQVKKEEEGSKEMKKSDWKKKMN
jgi:hypothetical protein